MPPHQTLHIDEISGEVRGSTNVFRKDFVGCWNEDGVSSLFFSAPHDEEMGAFVSKRTILAGLGPFYVVFDCLAFSDRLPIQPLYP
jgi:hypothetical protein